MTQRNSKSLDANEIKEFERRVDETLKLVSIRAKAHIRNFKLNEPYRINLVIEPPSTSLTE